MGLLDRTKRVDMGDGEWVEVRPFTPDELFDVQAEAEAASGDDASAPRVRALYAAMRSRIVAWSADVEPSPENTAKLDVQANLALLSALTGDSDLPLASGSPSTDTSTD